jgi:hypothetical protein
VISPLLSNIYLDALDWKMARSGFQIARYADDFVAPPKGPKQNSPWASALGRRPRENRPERAAECRALFPKKTFVESDSMAFQKLTKLFLIRKFAVDAKRV